ncbi:hypothetical protein Aph01nite_58990 [Acrocarpospora phusangensis]|uniref:CHAT domain-containing protein n=1 Tax=Acrocarpospora phusangensis TaxID=1070424 RepID=A0A919UN57_9ACTN|nr:tetratricopeptide repeat protein [Acrocarpospora phusangensis]GIH27589.1 hypothetical protein Aph01nite_58990 [Acrocarpospora phusangensis]
MSGVAGERYDVFIVHAQADLEWARRLQASLSRDGFRAALEHYLPGDVVIRRIEELMRASAVCVFVYSRAIETDPMMAGKYEALITEAVWGRRRFIPALLEDVPLDPFAAARVRVDFRGPDQEKPYRELVTALGRYRDDAGTPLPRYRDHRLEQPRQAILQVAREKVTLGRAYHAPRMPGQALNDALWKLGRARSGRYSTKSAEAATGSTVDSQLREVGRILGDGFLTGPAGDALAAELRQAERENSTLRLGLQIGDELAALPWETLVPPGETRPLALHPNVELYRHLPATAPTAAMDIRAPLRILAVVASPEGPGGGPLLDLEAELSRILNAVEDARRHAAAHVRILNEGTLDAIETALKQERFHVLHISCHARPGVLLLEDEKGAPVDVSAERLAGVIPRDRGVPLVVLSGCSTALSARVSARASGNRRGDDSVAEGEAVLGGLAQGLSESGVPAVLAMTGAVTDVYATMLTEAVYRELAVRPAPDVLTALSEARRDLEQARRSAPASSLGADLAEWATPALFLRGPVLPLYDTDDGVDTTVTAPPAIRLDPGVVVRAVGDFVGRRAELRVLRAALSKAHRSVVVHGIGGVGKSSLAAELIGRLGSDAGLVVSAFGRTSPDQVLSAIADKLLAATMRAGAIAEPLRHLAQALRRQDYPWALRLDALHQELTQVPSALQRDIGLPPITLLLDNFEENLDPADRSSLVDRELAAFLAAWARLAPRVRSLITSRHPFQLPGQAHDAVYFHHLGPLSLAEARKLMWRLEGLAALGPPDQERAWLDVGGHPRTLEYLDALLRGGRARFPDVRQRMEVLLERRGITDPGAWWSPAGAGLDVALAEAVTLAVDDTLLRDLLALVDEFARALLVGVSVFRRPVDWIGMAWPVSTPAPLDPERLERLERLGELLDQVRASDPGAGLEDLGLPAEELARAHEDVAAYYAPPIQVPEGVAEAVAVLSRLGLLVPMENGDIEWGGGRTYGGEWGGDGPAGLFLVHRWTAAGLTSVHVSAPEQVRAAHRAAAAYWMWRVATDAEAAGQDLIAMIEARFHFHAAGQREEAAGATDWICERLHQAGAWGWEQQLYAEAMSWFPPGSQQHAASLHQLGIIARERGDYEQALDWYRQSLSIDEELGNRAGVATSYHELGAVAQLRGDYEQALDWYRQSLSIKEEVGNRAGMATTYHALGIIARLRGDYEQALDWHRQGLHIDEELGDRTGVAATYHSLGIIAQEQEDHEQALDWHRQGLHIYEELGNRVGMAASYHSLGVIAQEQGDYERALKWYRQSLAIKEELGNRAGIAASYHQFGIIAQLGQDYERAREWYRQSLTIHEELGDRDGMAAGYGQLGAFHTQAGDPAEGLAYSVRSLLIYAELESPHTAFALGWLARQREVLGETDFQRLLAHHTPADLIEEINQALDDQQE